MANVSSSSATGAAAGAAAAAVGASERLVVVSRMVEGVRVLAFNRPAKRNALSQGLIDEFLAELAAASADASVRAIVVTGGDSFFSAGADIKEISALNAEDARQCRYLEDLCLGMRKVAFFGDATGHGQLTSKKLGGGFEVALMCDIILASHSSRFGLPEVTIGLLPGAGGTQRLTNAVGKFKAMKMILLGAPISAAEAHSSGLVAELYENGTVIENAVKMASRLAALSPTAMSLAKEAICRSRDDEFERSLYYFAYGTEDKREGVQAFLEKRSPTWPSIPVKDSTSE